MKIKYLAILAATVILTACSANQTTTPSSNVNEETITLVKTTDEETKHSYYFFDSLAAGYKSSRSDVLTPTFYIFSGKITLDEAKQQLTDLGLSEVVEQWASSVYVLPPANGENYSDEDATAFLDLVAKAPVTNVKVIGLDEGATFVNNQIAPKYSYLMAGVLSIGGEVEEGAALTEMVPAYISASSQDVVQLYTGGNKTKDNVYTDSKNPLQKVVVSDKEDLSDIFQDAWNQILSKNYRMHNDTTEFYMANPKEVTSGYGLEPIINFEELEVDYHQNEEMPLNGEGSYTWYEYVPKDIDKKDKQSVPLIVTQHGFGNDPRLQGDTSGWVELVAKEGLIVVSPEWQDKENNFAKVDGLDEDGVLKLVEYLKEEYPQINPNQIYITGLSAGGSKAALWAAKHPDVFAASASVSSPGIDKAELHEVSTNSFKNLVPYLYIVGDHDFFQMIPVDGSSKFGMPNVFFDDPNVSMFEFIQSYQRINGIAVSDKPDISLNQFYGLAFNKERWFELGTKKTFEGSLTNADGKEVIRLVAVENLAHWNYRPEAEYIWKFFKQYQLND
ncbi:TPA: prolyl oligopeptidase family serine peptidase [Streptococcus suis]|nr:prolyl oligopeptidase family serine peptidase [Streptococcus suis]HEL2411877.1 prolyl oligopeptidase family serine peptidase [Streptococcus suis]